MAQLAVGASPFRVYQVENPNGGSDYSTMKVTDTVTGQATNMVQYAWSASSNGWAITSGSGARYETRQNSYNSGTQMRTTTLTSYAGVGGPQGQVLVNQYQLMTLNNGQKQEKLVYSTLGSGNDAQTTTNTYYADSGLLQQEKRPDGSWTYFVYNAAGLKTKRVEGFKGATPDQYANESVCRVTDYSYDSLDANLDNGQRMITLPRLVTEKVKNQLVAKRFFLVLSDRTIEAQALSSSPSLTWNDPGNLFTTNFYDANWQKTRTILPDRTLITYSYTTNTGNNTLTTTITQGQADGTWTSVTNGQATLTVQNFAGAIVSRETRDVRNATVITLSLETYSLFDDLNRPAKLTYLDNSYVEYSYGCCGLDGVTDREGTSTFYSYDNLQRLVGSTRNGVTDWNQLDADGRVLVKTRLANGATNQVIEQDYYDTGGRLKYTTNALLGVTAYAYGWTNGQYFRQITRPEGGTVIEIYYRDGTLNKILGTAAKPVRYDYDIETSGADAGKYYAYQIKLDANGNDLQEWTKTYYDLAGRAYKTTYSNNSSQQSFYNALGQLNKEIDRDNYYTLYAYNGRGEVEVTTLDLDQDSQIDTNQTDRISFVLKDVYNKSGVNVQRSQTYVYGTNSSTVSNLLSTVERSCDGLQTWQTTHNGAQAVTQLSQIGYYRPTGYKYLTNTAPDGSKSISIYRYGRVQSVTQKDAAGAQLSQSTYQYDPYGRVSSVTDARNGATTYTYNNADLAVTVTTPAPGTGQAPQTTTYYYDTQGRQIGLRYPDNGTLTNLYHPDGELKLTYGSRTYPVGYGYDAQGRMTAMTNWTTYPAAGQRVTAWSYNAYQGLLEKKVYPGETDNTVDYEYTAGGRLWKRHWERGITTTYSYNSAGDLQTVDYSDATPDVTYGYDRRGRPNSITRNGITSALAYNYASQLTGETYAGGSLANLGVAKTYDNYLRLNQTEARANGSAIAGTTSTYGYNTTSGRLETATQNGYSGTYSYVANSPLVGQITFKQGTTPIMTTTKQYDKLNRLMSINSVPSGAGSVPVSYAYQYNDANQRTRASLADGSFWIYEYDQLGQVASGKKYWADGTPVPGQQFEYGFDEIGNRTGTKAGGDQSGSGLRPASYNANSLNQYSSRTVPGAIDVLGLANAGASVTVNSSPADYRRGEYFQELVTVNNTNNAVWQSVNVTTSGGGSASGNVFVPPATESFTHDTDGNLTIDGRWNYTWDGENRLIQMTTKAGVAGPTRRLEFEYDLQGRRIRKKVYDQTTGGTCILDNKFLYDGWNLIAELDGLNNNALIRSYLWGSDLSGTFQGAGGVGGLLKMATHTPSTTNYFVAYDGNGNVMGLVHTDSGANMVLMEYGPFGEPTRLAGFWTAAAKTCPFQFSTKYLDDESDLLYYGHRYLNVWTGRWPNRDPIGEKGGINLHVFVGNDGINNSDVLGLSAAYVQSIIYKKHATVDWDSGIDTYVEVPEEDMLTNLTMDEYDTKPGASVKLHLDVGFNAEITAWTQLNAVKAKSLQMSTDIAGTLTVCCPCFSKKIRADWIVYASLLGTAGSAHASFENNEAITTWNKPADNQSGTTDKHVNPTSYCTTFSFVLGQGWTDKSKIRPTTSTVKIQALFKCIY